MHRDDALQSGAVERFDDLEQAPVDRGLRFLQRGNGRARLLVRPRGRAERAAFHRVDVKMVDDQDVVERGAQAWKEAGSLRGEFLRRQPRAGGEQPVVCPGVVVRHGAVGKHIVHLRCRPVARMSDMRGMTMNIPGYRFGVGCFRVSLGDQYTRPPMEMHRDASTHPHQPDFANTSAAGWRNSRARWPEDRSARGAQPPRVGIIGISSSETVFQIY